MTHDEACAWLLQNAAKEYQDSLRDSGVRCFYYPMPMGTLNCGQNGKPPSFRVIAFPDVYLRQSDTSYEGGIEFEICGQAGDDRWLRATIYGCKRDELPELIDDAEYAAKRLWNEFAAVMNAVRPQKRSSDE